MDSPGDSILLRARCYCERHEFTTSIPASALPLHASLCHCTSCRHNTGALYFACTVWPDENEDLSSLKRYSFSPNTDIFSCEMCSSQLFCRGTKAGASPEVITSALDNILNLIKYSHHIFVGDTVDGGASILLQNSADGEAMKRWNGHKDKSEELPPHWPKHPNRKICETGNQNQALRPQFTRLVCHCKGVNLFIRGVPTIGSTSSDTRDASAQEVTRNEPKWCLDPYNGRPNTVINILPISRQSVSSDIPFWTHIPIKRIVPDAHVSVPSLFESTRELNYALAKKDPRVGTLIRNSKPSHDKQTIYTYSCRVCAATFFQVYDSNPDTIFVALGIMNHPAGARAGDFLSWRCDSLFVHQDLNGWRGKLYETVEHTLSFVAEEINEARY